MWNKWNFWSNDILKAIAPICNTLLILTISLSLSLSYYASFYLLALTLFSFILKHWTTGCIVYVCEQRSDHFANESVYFFQNDGTLFNQFSIGQSNDHMPTKSHADSITCSMNIRIETLLTNTHRCYSSI